MLSATYKSLMLSVIKLNVVMLSAVAPINIESFALMTNKLEYLSLPSLFSRIRSSGQRLPYFTVASGFLPYPQILD